MVMGLKIYFVVGLWVEEMYVLGLVCVEGMRVMDLFGWRECMCYVWVGMYVLGLAGECKLWVWVG